MIADLHEGKITVPKAQLLEKLHANRHRHAQEYEETLNGWREQMIMGFELLMSEARIEIDRLKETREYKGIRVPNLSRPKSHEGAYTRVIAMLEMSLAESVTITETQFRQYVMDEWDWQSEFTSSKMSYSNSNKR